MNKKISCLIAAASLLGFSSQANAAGFALIEQSVSGMGTAYAGGAASAEDASTIFFNPAGLTRLPTCDFQTVSGIHVVVPVADYDDKGSVDFTGAPLTGNDGRDAGEAAAVSHFYAAKRINDCWAVGLGINTPFGLVTDYDNHWKGRYHAIRSSVMTININPSLAYKINDRWSIGAGFSAQYLHAKLSNAIDYGGIAFAVSGSNSAIVDGVVPQSRDGRVQLKGNSWGWGGNIGILFEPCCGTRFGAHYRSQIKHRVSGSENFTRTPEIILDPTTSNGDATLIAQYTGIRQQFAIDRRAKAEITLPATISFSAYHQLNNCWAVLADASWTQWKTLKRLRFRFNVPEEAIGVEQPDGITTLKWQNSMRYSIGTVYTPDCCWKFRTGIAYDKTPIKNKHYRTPRIPGEDRFWAAMGVGYNWNNCVHFDFGYAHLFVKEPRINKTDDLGDWTVGNITEDTFRGGLHGKYDAYTDIISLQMVYNF